MLTVSKDFVPRLKKGLKKSKDSEQRLKKAKILSKD
jgi:hypothetical protein